MIGVTNGSNTAHLMVVMCVHSVVKYAYMTLPVRQFALRSWMVSVVRLGHAGVGLIIKCCLPLHQRISRPYIAMTKSQVENITLVDMVVTGGYCGLESE